MARLINVHIRAHCTLLMNVVVIFNRFRLCNCLCIFAILPTILSKNNNNTNNIHLESKKSNQNNECFENVYDCHLCQRSTYKSAWMANNRHTKHIKIYMHISKFIDIQTVLGDKKLIKSTAHIHARVYEWIYHCYMESSKRKYVQLEAIYAQMIFIP